MIESLDENNAIYVQESEFKLLTKGLQTYLTGEDSKVQALNAPYSKRQPAWHVVTLSILTLSIYNVYWFYKNLSLLNESPPTGQSNRLCCAHPFFSTMLFLVPVVNLIIALQFFAVVCEIYPQPESVWRKNSLFCAFALALTFGALFLFGVRPAPYHFLYLACCVPLALVQSLFNKYWQAQEAGLDGPTGEPILVRAAFNPIEIVIIVIGGAFLGLCAVGPSILPH